MPSDRGTGKQCYLAKSSNNGFSYFIPDSISGPPITVTLARGYWMYNAKYYQVGTKKLVTTGPVKGHVWLGHTEASLPEAKSERTD